MTYIRKAPGQVLFYWAFTNCFWSLKKFLYPKCKNMKTQMATELIIAVIIAIWYLIAISGETPPRI